MKTRLLSLLLLIIAATTISSFRNADSTSYKCMIQMTNYSGEGAYVVISLLDAQGEYVETLYVQGDDSEWYHDITEWWGFYGKKRNNIDAISGETLAGGERTISVINIDNAKIDAGYSLRFETAVEDQEYYADDVRLELTRENISKKHEGNGFIRYIRMIPN